MQSAGQLGAKSLRGSAAAWPTSAWWRGYGDPQLNALVEEALAGSPDVAIAAARLRAAEAAAQQAGAALVPSLELDASVAAAQEDNGADVSAANVANLDTDALRSLVDALPAMLGDADMGPEARQEAAALLDG